MKHLLIQRKFLPYFLTQALGAFNDNLYKNVLLILVAFAAPRSVGMDANLYINLATGLFILPFFLFSPFAGELADKYEKSFFIRRTKMAELIIMLLAAIAFTHKSYPLLLLLLFLMGTQSAFFGPVKYSLLPQVTPTKQLLSANAWVEAATFLAILGGTILGGIIAGKENPTLIAAIAVTAFALLGLISAYFIPQIEASNPNLVIRLAWKSQFAHTLSIIREDRNIWFYILAISWFWFLGAGYLTQFPNFTRLHLGGTEEVVSALLVLFSVGIATGSLLCTKLKRINCTKIGILGLSLSGLAFYLFIPENPTQNADLLSFISNPSLWGVFVSMLWIGISGGLYVVPLFTQIQQRANTQKRSQIIAGSNIFDALFIVLSALLGILMLAVLKMSIPKYFLALSLLNTAIAYLILHQAAFSLTNVQAPSEKA